MKKWFICAALLIITTVFCAAMAEEVPAFDIAEAPATSAGITFTQQEVEAAGGSWTKSKNGELWISLPGATIDWLSFDSKGNLTQWAENTDENTRTIYDGTGAVTSISYLDPERNVRSVWTSEAGWSNYAENESGTWELVSNDAPQGVETPAAAK